LIYQEISKRSYLFTPTSVLNQVKLFKSKIQKGRYFYEINAIVALLFGIGSMFAPAIMLDYYGAKTINAELIQMTRFFSSAIFCYAAMSWFARNAEASEARTAILLIF